MAHKRFTNQAGATDREQLTTYTLDGTRWRDGKPWEELFTCLPEAPAGAMDDLAASTSMNERGQMLWHQPSVMRFLLEVTVPEDRERLLALVHDPERIVKLEQLGELTLFLSEELVGHPTNGRVSSGAMRAPDGRTSTAALSERG